MSKQENNSYLVTAIAAVVTIVVLVVALRESRESQTSGTSTNAVHRAASGPDIELAPQPIDAKDARVVGTLTKEQLELDESVWANEVRAQRFEEPFIRLWDNLRAATNAWDVMANFAFEQLEWRAPGELMPEGFGLAHRKLDGAKVEFTRKSFGEFLGKIGETGYRLEKSEWHHARFVPKQKGPPDSVFNVNLYVIGPSQKRMELAGELHVQWQDGEGRPVARILRVENARILERQGPPAFAEVPLPLQKFNASMPILSYDLDADGLLEIIMPSHNLVLWNRGNFKFERATLMEQFPEGLQMKDVWKMGSQIACVIDEFTGDDRPDYVAVLPPYGVFLWEMDENRKFSSKPRLMFRGNDDFVYPRVASSGDVNGDGMTDLWFGQYFRTIYRGNFPKPVFDATNGHPAYLFLNRGEAGFEDATDSAGLAHRRTRLTFSGSLWDFDTDGDMDLITVNDFSGVDSYRNDGKGKFEDLRGKFVDERANFGMGHTIADFNRDGEIDFYVTGMSSTTARRLEAMGLDRDEFPDVQNLRMKMAYGSRMYYGGKNGFTQAPIGEQVARTGWSWGTGTLDFGNDGWPDLYVANGFLSRKTCRDYCTRFWTHEIYTDTTLPASTQSELFRQTGSKWFDDGVSWNGFEKNRLYLNRGGTNYLSAAHPMGVAFEYDTRTVLIEDFDNDGRQDLLLVNEDTTENPTFWEIVHLYRNVWPQNGNWIGIRLSHGRGGSLYGSRIELTTEDGKRVAVLVNGDSYACQHSTTKHFGLGELTKVTAATVIWPDGTKSVVENPAINKYHTVVRSR